MILSSFFKALGQIGDARFRRVLFIGILLSFALLVVFNAAFLWFLQWSLEDGAELPIIGRVTWLGDLLTWGSFGLMLIFSAFLMVP